MHMKKILAPLLFFVCLLSGIKTATAGTWYRGDLHAHSLYSDGDSTVAAMLARAEALGFDFFTLTEHDTSLGGSPRHWSDPDYSSETMALLYGIEWTTAYGHANIWAAQPFSYEELWQANRENNPEAALAAAHTQSALFSLNHPSSILPSLQWDYPVPEEADGIEVWNSLYRLPSLNRWAGHGFWDDLLRQGRRIPGVGGSDAHMLYGWMSRFWGPGNPTTWVYAEELTAEAILAGIKAGRVTISYAPDAVRVLLSADADGDGTYETLNGDAVQGAGQVLSYRVSIEDPAVPGVTADGAVAELDHALVQKLAQGAVPVRDITGSGAGARLAGVFKNGHLFRVWVVFGRSASFTFRDVAVAPSYYRVEVTGSPAVSPVNHLLYGRVIALTNPVYVE
jgi:hypothetical protein